MMKKLPPKRRNAAAKALASPAYRAKVIPNKKKKAKETLNTLKLPLKDI
jgi:hypothetical protein